MPGPVQSVFIPIPTALALMIANTQAEGAAITDFTEGSVARTLYEADAVVISSQSQVADQLQLDSFLETAEGEALDAQGANWLVPRLAAVQATGKVTIKRESSSGALTIPSGWAQLTVPPAIPGTEGVGVVTTEDANFTEGSTEVTVAAQAVVGGTAGNLADHTKLTPTSAVIGVSSSEGYEVTTAFSGGVNEESDEKYRARIPKVVQGRVPGKKVSFEGAVLSVPGVLSVGVLRAGTERSNSTQVAAGHVEIVYQGLASLLTAVEAAVENAATINQKTETFAAISLSGERGQKRVVLEMTVYCAPGVNTTALKEEVAKVAIAFVEKVGLGNTLYMSTLIETIHALPEVVSVGIPLTKLAIYPSTGAADITTFPDQYVNLAEADCHITVTEL